METLSLKDFAMLLEESDLKGLIAVSSSFENRAKALLGFRKDTLSPPVKREEREKLQERITSSLPEVKKPLAPKKEAIKTPEKATQHQKSQEPPKISDATIALCNRGFSHLHFTKEIPEDSHARIIKQHYLWKYPDTKVVILSFSHDEAEKLMWKRLSQALSNLRCKSICIDALEIDHPAKWKCLFDNRFSLILAPVKTLLQIPALSSSYAYTPHTHEHHLFGMPMMPLKAAHQYLEHPDLKKELWNHLCRTLALPKSP